MTDEIEEPKEKKTRRKQGPFQLAVVDNNVMGSIIAIPEEITDRRGAEAWVSDNSDDLRQLGDEFLLFRRVAHVKFETVTTTSMEVLDV